MITLNYSRDSKQWDDHYFRTHFRLTQYLVGVWLGFLMLKIDSIDCIQKIPTIVSLFGWTMALGFMIFHVYFQPDFYRNQYGHNIYNSTARFLWACSISWIIFSCHHLKSGGLIRSLLSHHFWQPLSKLGLSVYLVHYIYINYVETNSLQPKDGFSLYWIIQISAGDVFISFFLGALFHLFVEAPIGNLIALLLDRSKFRSENIPRHLSETDLIK